MTDGFEHPLLIAIAAELAAATLPGGGAVRKQLAWKVAPAVYSASDIGVHLGVEPDVPGSSVTIGDYVVRDEVGGEDSIMGLQVRIRAASPAELRGISADVFDRWHGRSRCTLGGIIITSARRVSGTPLGQDRNGRLGRSENYYLTVARPTITRT